MKKLTKILVACLVLFAIVFSFASCEMLRTVDKMNEIQNKMYDNGYSVDKTGDRYSMSYALGFEVATFQLSVFIASSSLPSSPYAKSEKSVSTT